MVPPVRPAQVPRRADGADRHAVDPVGLDVLPVEPPVEPIPELLRAYRAREPWCEGRLIITPHSAFFTPEAWDDTRLKSAETMRAALSGRGRRTSSRRRCSDSQYACNKRGIYNRPKYNYN
jgi:phosphoglycerate dehydrogenase-like enzyme